jgi:hypothetical protein
MDKLNAFLAARYEWLIDPNPATWDAYQNAANNLGTDVKLTHVLPRDMEGFPDDNRVETTDKCE